MTEREWVELRTYYSLEPFGPRADWTAAAVIACTVANAAQGKRGKKFTIEDFMPEEPNANRQQTPDEMLAALAPLMAAPKDD